MSLVELVLGGLGWVLFPGLLFFLIGVNMMAASLFNCPNLCFFAIVCILCAHTRAAYFILGFTTVRKSTGPAWVVDLSIYSLHPQVGIDTFWL